MNLPPIVSESNANYKSDEITFVCLAKYDDVTYKKSAEMNILFIGTNTAGYSVINGVKCLTLNKAGTPLNVALLNLGQSDGNDAGDLGDFYQWGRVADGHQKTTWSKNASHVDQILPMDNVATSAVVAYSSLATDATTAAANYQTAAKADNVTPFHQVLSSSGGYGKFISATYSNKFGYYQWYNPGYNTSDNDNYLWGQSTQHVTSNRNPVKNGNDPCPTNWKVPSKWLFSDLYDNNGSSETNSNINYYTGTNNAWVWRAYTNNAVGGAVITNATGEKLFLPAAGYRPCYSGAVIYIGDNGLYWSSTYDSTHFANTLYFHSGAMYAGNNYEDKANGFSVRCVAE